MGKTSSVYQIAGDRYRTVRASHVEITGSVDAAILLDLVIRLHDNSYEHAESLAATNAARIKEGLEPHFVPGQWLYHTTAEYASWTAGALTEGQIKKIWPILEEKGLIENGGRHPEYKWSGTTLRRLNVAALNDSLRQHERAKRPAREVEMALSEGRNGPPGRSTSPALLNTSISIQRVEEQDAAAAAAPPAAQNPLAETATSNNSNPKSRGSADWARSASDIRPASGLKLAALPASPNDDFAPIAEPPCVHDGTSTQWTGRDDALLLTWVFKLAGLDAVPRNDGKARAAMTDLKAQRFEWDVFFDFVESLGGKLKPIQYMVTDYRVFASRKGIAPRVNYRQEAAA